MQGLSAEGMKHFFEQGRIRHFAPNEIIFYEGDPAEYFFIILNGQVEMSKQGEKGNSLIIKHCHPAECIALVAVMQQMSYPLTAKATEDCTLLAWRGMDFRHEIQLYPILGLNAMDIVANKFLHVQQLYLDVSHLSVEQRIAKAVLRLAESTHLTAERSIKISRQQLAEMASTTIYTVSRTLAQWEKLGWLSSERNRILLHEKAALAQVLTPKM
jgi:CRP-like cAMP-binding protein